MAKRRPILFTVVFLVFVCMATMGAKCGEKTVEEKGTEAQTNLMEKAQKAVPVPEVNNFQTRKMVAKWMRRMDEPSKEFYCYLMASNGQIVHHFVTNGRPISAGSFMTPPKKEYSVGGGTGPNPLGPAPALDGVYYGQGSSAGTARFAFDAATDAYFEVAGVGNFVMIITDQPLNIDSPRLKIQAN